jgi:hypothetical protein
MGPYRRQIVNRWHRKLRDHCIFNFIVLTTILILTANRMKLNYARSVVKLLFCLLPVQEFEFLKFSLPQEYCTQLLYTNN